MKSALLSFAYIKIILPLVFFLISFLTSSISHAELHKNHLDLKQPASNQQNTDQQSASSEINKEQKKQSEKPEVEILITGIEGKLYDNAMAHLVLKKSMDDEHFSTGWLKKLHKIAESNIQKSLQPFGYYQVQVVSNLEQKENNIWLAEYVVTPGEQVKITELSLVVTGPGKDDPKIKALIDEFPIKIGDPLHHTEYEEAKLDITKKIGRIGYSQVVTHTKKVYVDPKNNSAKLNIRFESGPKFYLGAINFHQDMLNEDFILSYIKNIKIGDPLAYDALVELQHTLYSSGYFSLVDVKPDFNKANGDQIPIDITLEPGKRHKFSFGAGVDTEIGVNVSARWNYRRINQYGHYADIVSKLSTKKSNIRTSYWIPAGDPRTDKYGIITTFETEDTDTTDRSTFDLELGYWFETKVENENKKRTNNWENTLFVEYKLEHFTVGDDDKNTTHLFSLGARSQRVNFEDKPFPRKGWGLFGEIRGSAFISDVDYLRLFLKSRVLLPVAENGRLVLRGDFGVAETNDYDLYPSSLRFYAGGDQSVRGYKWQALGPKDDKGNVIGGRNVVTGSIEYDHKLTENWVAAGFFDAGNAFNDELDTIYYGTGFGARYISPIGLIKVDIGFPLKKDEDISDDDFVLYFGFEINL